MRVAYVTTDEVNQDQAMQIARERGVTLFSSPSRELLARGRFDAVLFDWDYLPRDDKRQILSEAFAGLLSCPTGLHSYNLTEDLREALRENGVATFSRLEPGVFRALRRLVHQQQKSRPDYCTHTVRAQPVVTAMPASGSDQFESSPAPGRLLRRAGYQLPLHFKFAPTSEVNA